MKPNKRIKTAALAFIVPQNAAEANSLIAQIGRAQRERERIQIEMNEALGAVKDKHEREAAPFATEIANLTQALQIWCEAHRDDLTQHGKVKYHRFAHGEVCWRMRPMSVFVRKVEDVLHNLRALGLSRFIRTKDEINKEAMLADPVSANQVEGVKVRSAGEEFVVKPSETSLEEVCVMTIELTDRGKRAAGAGADA